MGKTKKQLWDDAVKLGLIEKGVEYDEVTAKDIQALIKIHNAANNSTDEKAPTPPKKAIVPAKSLCDGCGDLPCKQIQQSMGLEIPLNGTCIKYRKP